METVTNQPPWHQPNLAGKADTSLPALKIYNSLTRSKNPFVPLDPDGKSITWYACGPTVYDDAHLGHARNYVTTDILRRILRDYFKFNVRFVMNITDVDDKIIVRARQQHLFSKYRIEHPEIDTDVLHTSQKAYEKYIKKYLPLLPADVQPELFQQEAEKKYRDVLNGQPLPGNKKPGDDEAKIKMHLKTVTAATKVIQASSSQSEGVQAEAFYSTAVKDLLLFYLDSLYGSELGGNDHSIFTDLTKRYEDRFMQDARDLNILDPDEVTRVTEYGPQIIKFVEQVVHNRFGYETSDHSVYFDVESFEAAGNVYTRLEPWNRDNRPLQEDGEGALTKKGQNKRSRVDFALWKASNPGEPSWSSPWGNGRPGWHIECSAMASDRLGPQIDIHSGGIDLAFPHHDNELAQSEAYWYTPGKSSQWVNYFLHMGHLSISGSKMSKSLKNFITIREALKDGTWTSRGLRIIFLLGAWRDAIEITEDLMKAGRVLEDKFDNFFLNAKALLSSEVPCSGSDHSLKTALQSAQESVHTALLDSFNTPGAMNAISGLISQYNNIDKQNLNVADVKATATWITSMVNIFGLNGTKSYDSSEIGWEGIDIPELLKPFVYPLARIRDTLRKAAIKSDNLILGELKEIVGQEHLPATSASDPGKLYADLFAHFRSDVESLHESDRVSQEILRLCDRVRDVDLFNAGIYLEDREDRPALVRPVSREMREEREAQARKLQQKQLEREKAEKKLAEKIDKGKINPREMFRTSEYTEWDSEGLPLKDASGEEITKSRKKKLQKDWERQQKLHETWLKGSS